MIEVLLAMSMLALLGYFMADMIVSQQTSISSSESRLEGVEVFRQIHDLVASDDSCAKVLLEIVALVLLFLLLI